MKTLIWIITIITLITFNGIGFAQSRDSVIVDDNSFEELLEDFSDESEDANALDDLEEYLLNPLDLNTATLNDLITLPFFDISSANLIIEHRRKFGFFYSPYELRLVTGLNKDFVEKIIPFFKASKIEYKELEYSMFDDIKRFTKVDIRSRFQSDLQNRRGFLNGNYLGSKLKSYQRMGINYDKKLTFGFLIEKDAAEKSYNDFQSFYFEYSPKSFVEKIIVGDYLVEFGQGLTLWSPYGFSKGADAISPLFRKDKNIRAYRSTDENRFRRGAASVFSYKKVRLSLFFSKNSFDANIDSQGIILSRPLDGYHRTNTEISKQNAADELILGTRVDYKILDNLEINYLFMKTKLSGQLVKRSSIFDPEGDEFNYNAVAYKYYIGSFYATGEYSYNGISLASLNNFQFKLTNNFVLVTSVRNYPRNYYSLLGTAFAEQGSKVQNEFGIYTGFRYRTPFGLFNVYYDQFKFPSATSDILFPSKGNEIIIDYRENLTRVIETNIRYKREIKDVASSDVNSKNITNRIKQNYRLEASLKLSSILRLRSRLEFVDVKIINKNNEYGWMFFQDVKWEPFPKTVLSSRMIVYKTDSFNSAVYVYENDLPGIMTSSAVYEEGIRWYLVVSHTFFKNIKLGIKYSETYKPRKLKLSSGNSEIDGNIDNKLNFQLDILF